MLPVDEALAIVLSHTPRLSAEPVLLEEALGRVLADDVAADADLPPFERAAMDGYAVRALDLSSPPVVLPVAGMVRAGQFPEAPLVPGTAVQIMTGAPVPDGADAVLQVERTRPAGEGRVELLAAVEAGTNVAHRGSEVRAGDLVLRAGHRVTPASLAVLASVGCARPLVARRPRLAMLVTGDELVGVNDRPGPGQIRNSNGPAVLAQARLAGAEVSALGVARDEMESLAVAMAPGFEADVLCVSGGVSEGVFDLVEPVFARFGVEVLFTKVAIKPGAPLVFGRRGATLVFGLPGNPVSAMVTFDVFVRPALLRMQGMPGGSRPQVEVELRGPVKNRSGRRLHHPAVVRAEDGRLYAEPVRSMGSADVAAHARANALLVLEAGRTAAAAGERALALLLPPFVEGIA